jgi:hypothetical protein
VGLRKRPNLGNNTELLPVPKVKRTLRRSWKSLNTEQGIALDRMSLLRDPDDKHEIGYLAAVWAQVGWPHSPLPAPPPDSAPVWRRKNGNLEFRVTSLSGAGIPSGVIPRQFAALLCTDVIARQNEPDYWVVDLGSNMSDLMKRRLNIEPTGGKHGSITRFKNAAWMMMTCAVSVTQYPGTPRESQKFKATTLAEEIELWENFKNPDADTLWKNYAILNRKFADGIIQGSVPFSLTVFSGLRESALGLDLYPCFLRRWWQIEKNGGKSQFIAYDDLRYWFGSQYADDKTGRQSFKRKANTQIGKIVQLLGGDGRVTINQQIRGEGGKPIQGIWLHNSPRAIVRPEQMQKQLKK